MKQFPKPTQHRQSSGKLRIGDQWNAITIIALSQSNPLKAVAEFVENSIDAKAERITIVRGKERGEPYLRITDDGEGVPKNDDGLPDFKYVATHVCDSIKRHMKAQNRQGIQGEFGIGLLSFWTVGETLTMVSAGLDGKAYEMRMARGDPNYAVKPRRRLFADQGTEITIKPLLAGIRQFSGEKLQWYLASELRDRIRNSGVEIQIVDRQARAEFRVEPRQFSGRMLHHLAAPATPQGEIYTELYLAEPNGENQIGLYRSGTRVLENIAQLAPFQGSPWNSGYFQGILDAPFLNLTPGTRLGIIQDEAFAAFCQWLGGLEKELAAVLDEQKKAEQEQTSRQTLRSIQRAFREALLALPEEEYDWFRLRKEGASATVRPGNSQRGLPLQDAHTKDGANGPPAVTNGQDTAAKEFFEHPGPLYSVRIAPATCVVSVGKTKNLRVVARDKSRRQVEENLVFRWEITEGEGTLDRDDAEIVTLTVSEEPTLMKVGVTVTQGDMVCQAEALVTVTDSLLPEKPSSDDKRGLPGYTFQKAPGELWRSRYDTDQNVIVINNGHRDFVYASRQKSLKLRYVCRLFSKELVLRNFPGTNPESLLERMIELSLYTEENLR
jgi:hypothetical protein